MPIDYEHLMSLRTRGERVQYTPRDTLLYALGIGLGRDPDSSQQLAYVEGAAGLKTVPSFASILVDNQLLADCGWNPARVVPWQESVSLERPLDDAGSLLVDSDVVTVLDKGADAGALITVESRARRERDGQAQFTVRRTWLARGDGGFGGPQGTSVAKAEWPARRPDMTHRAATRVEQGHLFRAAKDRNRPKPAVISAYSDPARPVLDALCLQGIACLAILEVICDYDHTLIQSLACQFGGAARAGETLVTELWQDANVVSCRVRAEDRGEVLLDQARCVLAA